MFYLYTFLACLLGAWIYKPLRFYLLSFLFEWLYRHQTVGKLLGIMYTKDDSWTCHRNDTYVYMAGIFIRLFVMFTGMEVILTDQIRTDFQSLQQRHSRDITMEPYFNEIEGKTITANEFENFLSKAVLVETNRVFKILDDNREKELLKHILIMRDIVNGLTGGMVGGVKMVYKNWNSIMKISRIFKSVPEHQRLLLFVPQLTLVNNFTMMLAETQGDMNKIKPYEFVDAKVKFSVFVCRDQLVIVERIKDTRNTETNRAFGPGAVICPGNIYTMKFVKSIIAFLQTFNINVVGVPIIEGERFANLMNKDSVKFTFTKNKNIAFDTDKWNETNTKKSPTGSPVEGEIETY